MKPLCPIYMVASVTYATKTKCKFQYPLKQSQDIFIDIPRCWIVKEANRDRYLDEPHTEPGLALVDQWLPASSDTSSDIQLNSIARLQYNDTWNYLGQQ